MISIPRKTNLMLLMALMVFLYGCEQAPPTPVPESKLSIICNKKEASVFIDGKRMGQCPMEVIVPAGDHVLSISTVPSKGEHYEFSKNINIGEGVSQFVEAKLKVVYNEEYMRGKKLYNEGNKQTPTACSVCHGLNALGDEGMETPSLAGLTQEYLTKQLADYASGKRIDKVMYIMESISKGLTKEDQSDVSAYISSLPAK